MIHSQSTSGTSDRESKRPSGIRTGLVQQSLLWAVERPCPFRFGKNWQSPQQTFQQLHSMRHPSQLQPHFRSRVSEESAPTYAAGARAKADCLAHDLCSSCEANVPDTTRIQLAGCHGVWTVTLDPFHWYQNIEETIRLQEMDMELSRLFPATSPRWFGFWMQRLLSPDQCGLLWELFSRVDVASQPNTTPFPPPRFQDWKSEPPSDACKSFLAALERCRDFRLPLRVQLQPPFKWSHGSSTILSSCEHCQAPCLPHENCTVCGLPSAPHTHLGRNPIR